MGDVLREGAKVVGTACGDDLKALLVAPLGRELISKATIFVVHDEVCVVVVVVVVDDDDDDDDEWWWCCCYYCCYHFCCCWCCCCCCCCCSGGDGGAHNPCAEKRFVSGKQWNFFPTFWMQSTVTCSSKGWETRSLMPTRMGLRFFPIHIIRILFELQTILSQQFLTYILYIYIYIHMIHLCITSSIPSSSSWASPILTSIFHRSLSSYGRVSGSAGSFWWATTLRQWAQHPACGDFWIWCTNPLSSCS